MKIGDALADLRAGERAWCGRSSISSANRRRCPIARKGWPSATAVGGRGFGERSDADTASSGDRRANADRAVGHQRPSPQSKSNRTTAEGRNWDHGAELRPAAVQIERRERLAVRVDIAAAGHELLRHAAATPAAPPWRLGRVQLFSAVGTSIALNRRRSRGNSRGRSRRFMVTPGVRRRMNISKRPRRIGAHTISSISSASSISLWVGSIRSRARPDVFHHWMCEPRTCEGRGEDSRVRPLHRWATHPGAHGFLTWMTQGR